MWSILQESDSGNVDYLVIETSGVTDPCTVVQTLEAEYGKMYRIRLDSVVLVRTTLETPRHTHTRAGAPHIALSHAHVPGRTGGASLSLAWHHADGSFDQSLCKQVLDADEVSSRVDEGVPPVHPNQLACADVVLLNKCDLVDPHHLDSATAYLAGAIPGVEVRSVVPL